MRPGARRAPGCRPRSSHRSTALRPAGRGPRVRRRRRDQRKARHGGSTDHHREVARDARRCKFARFVTRNRCPVAMLLIATTLFFFYPILNAVLTGAGPAAARPDRARRHQRARLCPGSSLHPRAGQVLARCSAARRWSRSASSSRTATIFTPERDRRRSARSRGGSTASATTATPRSATRCATSSRQRGSAPTEIRSASSTASSRPTR